MLPGGHIVFPAQWAPSTSERRRASGSTSFLSLLHVLLDVSFLDFLTRIIYPSGFLSPSRVSPNHID